MKILFLYQVHKHPEIKNLIQTLQKKGSQTSRDKKTLIQYLQKVHEHPEIKTLYRICIRKVCKHPEIKALFCTVQSSVSSLT